MGRNRPTSPGSSKTVEERSCPSPNAGSEAEQLPGPSRRARICKAGREIACWGYDDGRATPLPGAFTSVVAVDRPVCGVRADGRVDC